MLKLLQHFTVGLRLLWKQGAPLGFGSLGSQAAWVGAAHVQGCLSGSAQASCAQQAWQTLLYTAGDRRLGRCMRSPPGCRSLLLSTLLPVVPPAAERKDGWYGCYGVLRGNLRWQSFAAHLDRASACF